ncbi:hypothetical protein B0H19DRAFT_1104623 [Mycena capillaripes]|nr:hypothetical protein B0H19DRAFT_1104623 [Mycena capillaripes]
MRTLLLLVLDFILAAAASQCVDSSLLCSNMDSLNSTLFTPENDDVPAGTYIAMGISAVEQLAEYLESHPESKITRLLISDSTIRDVDTWHGYLSASFRFADSDYGLVERKDLTDEEQLRLDHVWSNNAEANLRIRRAVCDIEVPLMRILDKAAPSLETLSFLTYISDFSYDLTCDGTRRTDDPRFAALLGYTYPSLQHLTLRFPDNADWSEESAHPWVHASHFPSVTHLHIVPPDYTGTPPLASLLDRFRRLTHLRVTGLLRSSQLPADMRPNHYAPGFVEGFKEHILSIAEPLFSVPGNLTVMVQPGFYPMLNGNGGWCGTPGLEYDDLFESLTNRLGVYVKLPSEEDYRSYPSQQLAIAPLRRAIAEFEDTARGGDGDWAIPEYAGREEWWWNNPAHSAQTAKDDTEL